MLRDINCYRCPEIRQRTCTARCSRVGRRLGSEGGGGPTEMGVRGSDGFEGGDQQFTAWVFTIARRRVIDGARRRARRPRSGPFDGIDPADPTTAAALSAAEELETTLDLLRRLTPDQREVVALRVIAGMSVAETADVVGKSEAAVRVLCHRGLRTLADHVDADRLSSEESA